MIRLGDILDLENGALASREIGGIAFDSRKVEPGDVFFALAGAKDDGLRHAGEAVARGAAAIVAERDGPVADAPFVKVADARKSLAHAAARIYPRQPATIVAVTGTSGKTSVAAFARQIWASLGLEAASLGTIGVVSRPLTVYGSLTTPDPIALHRTLDGLAEAGVTHLALEASSHGLDQKRLDGVRLAAGAFTNLTRDHLDYHATVEDYLAAKLRLFRELLPAGAPAIVDADSDIAPRVIEVATARGLTVFTVGAGGEGIRLASVAREGLASMLEVEFGGRRRKLRLPLPGDFQIANALVAAGLCIATGSEADAVFAACARSTAHPGGSSASARFAAPPSSSTMPTSPMRWKRRFMPSGRMCAGASSLFSAAAAIAMPASDRSWERSRRAWPMWRSSPTTILAPRSPLLSVLRSSPWPGARLRSAIAPRRSGRAWECCRKATRC